MTAQVRLLFIFIIPFQNFVEITVPIMSIALLRRFIVVKLHLQFKCNLSKEARSWSITKTLAAVFGQSAWSAV